MYELERGGDGDHLSEGAHPLERIRHARQQFGSATPNRISRGFVGGGGGAAARGDGDASEIVVPQAVGVDFELVSDISARIAIALRVGSVGVIVRPLGPRAQPALERLQVHQLVAKFGQQSLHPKGQWILHQRALHRARNKDVQSE